MDINHAGTQLLQHGNTYVSIEVDSPGGQHTNNYPVVRNEIEPKEKEIYNTLTEGEDKYKKYAEEGGFDVRKQSFKKSRNKDVIIHRVMVCSKAGKPQAYNYDTLTTNKGRQKRQSTTQKMQCPTFAQFRLDPETSKYVLFEIEKRHNHKLVTASDAYLLKSKRKLNYSDEKFIYDVSECNIGPTKAHSLVTTLKGGHDQVRGTKVEYKNCARDLHLVIGGYDTTITIKRMENRKENVQNFSFEYRSDNSELVGLFWADETAKANYKEFGEMVSFDATYSMNK